MSIEMQALMGACQPGEEEDEEAIAVEGYTILYPTILYYTILYYTMLYYSIVQHRII